MPGQGVRKPAHTKPVFPCPELPSEAGAQKLLGVYPQAQEGRWLQRVRVPAGRLSGSQWQALAGVARRLAPDTPLHLTTRQDVEIHDLSAAQVPMEQRVMADAGLSCYRAAGDTFRNITVCPCSGLRPGSVDLAGVAEAIAHRLAAMDGIDQLPRKFKIALSCSASCGQPWINDIGLVARQQDGRWGFQVILGGSLGARHGTGMELLPWLAAEDAPSLAAVVAGVFALHGDRQNRRRARLRHVRERLGDQTVADLVLAALRDVRARDAAEAVELPPADGRFPAAVTLTFPDGDVTPQAAEALADLADAEDLRVRIANQHRVIVFGAAEQAICGRLAAHGALAAAAAPQPCVVACPGRRWCRQALVHTRGVAHRIRRELAALLPPDATLSISGCPNGCAHPAVADIGLTGCLAGNGEGRCEAFHLALGGGMGRDSRLAQTVAARVPTDAVVAEIARRLA